MYYFAYGSNLLAKRLRARVGNARLVGIARLPGWRMHFNFLCGGGASYCDILHTGENDEVWGAVFAIPVDRIKYLDRCEGCPDIYHREFVEVEINGQMMKVLAYVGTNGHNWIRPNTLPYDWYARHVVVGAEQVGLPQYYQEFLRMQPSRPDHIGRFRWESQFWQ